MKKRWPKRSTEREIAARRKKRMKETEGGSTSKREIAARRKKRMKKTEWKVSSSLGSSVIRRKFEGLKRLQA